MASVRFLPTQNRVLAHGGHYANVAIEFFDGDPKRGGTRIGRPQVLPVVWAGSVGTAQVVWDTTGKSGIQDPGKWDPK